jgi:hypothetical protein
MSAAELISRWCMATLHGFQVSARLRAAHFGDDDVVIFCVQENKSTSKAVEVFISARAGYDRPMKK